MLLFIIALNKMPCIMQVHSALHKYTQLLLFLLFNALINASRFHLHQKKWICICIFNNFCYSSMLTRWVFWWCLSPLLSLSDCLSPLPNESRNSHLITAHCTQTFQSCWLIESLSLHQHHKGGRTHEAFKCFCKVSTHWSACWAFEALVSGQCDMMSWIIMRRYWHFHAI